MALCAGVATITLMFGVLRSLPEAVRRIATVDIPLPVRSIAVLLVTTSVVILLARPRPSVATVPPPIVRLADGGVVSDGAGEARVSVPVSAEVAARARPTPKIRSVAAEPSVETHVVREGDCLWRIAEHALVAQLDGMVTNVEVAQFWPVIYEANRALIGDDPHLIIPGQILHIPEV